MATFDYRRDALGLTEPVNGSGSHDPLRPTFGSSAAAAPQAAHQLQELQARLAALQRYTAKSPRASVPGGQGSADPVYEAERELAELRLEIREQFLRAESLALELSQTQAALTHAASEADRVRVLLQESEIRADRYRVEAESLRSAVDDLRGKERDATTRSDALQRQITDLTTAQIELLRAKPASPREERPAAAPAVESPPATAAPRKQQAMFRGRPIE